MLVNITFNEDKDLMYFTDLSFRLTYYLSVKAKAEQITCVWAYFTLVLILVV